MFICLAVKNSLLFRVLAELSVFSSGPPGFLGSDAVPSVALPFLQDFQQDALQEHVDI